MEESIFTGEMTLESLSNQTQEIIIALSARIEARFQDMEQVIEKLEKQIATLILGFGEQAVNMEGLLAQIRFSTPDAQKAFMDTIAHSRKQMLQVMKEGAGGLLAGESPGVASALEDLVAEKLSDGTDQ
jgi:hypothetical protein